jgi:hypothetical protein
LPAHVLPGQGESDLLLRYVSMSGMSNQALPILFVITQIQQVHEELRREVANRDDELLNWTPCRGANSVATIVTHTLSSEAETLRAIAGIPGRRNRDAEFKMGSQSRADLLDQIRQADALLEDLAPMLTDDQVLTPIALPTLSPTRPRHGASGWQTSNPCGFYQSPGPRLARDGPRRSTRCATWSRPPQSPSGPSSGASASSISSSAPRPIDPAPSATSSR